MSTIDQILKSAKTVEVKYAFIDLACLLLFADKKSAISVQNVLEKLFKLETDPSERLEKRYQLTMAKVKASSFQLDPFLATVKKNLGTKDFHEMAIKFSAEFIKTGDNPSSKEGTLLQKITAQLRNP